MTRFRFQYIITDGDRQVTCERIVLAASAKDGMIKLRQWLREFQGITTVENMTLLNAAI